VVALAHVLAAGHTRTALDSVDPAAEHRIVGLEHELLDPELGPDRAQWLLQQRRAPAGLAPSQLRHAATVGEPACSSVCPASETLRWPSTSTVVVTEGCPSSRLTTSTWSSRRVAASFVRPRTPARRPVSATSYAALHAAADEVSEGALDARRAGHHASVAPQPIMNRDVDEAMSGHGFVRTASGREPGAAVQSVTAVVALGWGADP